MKNNEIKLKYGCNPHQSKARVFSKSGDLPFTILNGQPGYINLLDTINSWQLVKELKAALNLPAAASFKHVSPAGAGVGLPLDDVLKNVYFVDDIELSPIATAYARARGADRISSFGDWVAISDRVDISTAKLLKREVSDGIIASGYDSKALEILKQKKKGKYIIIEIDPNYIPPEFETREVYGITFEQNRNNYQITSEILKNVITVNRDIPSSAVRDLLVATIALKYTQSNSVCLAFDGQVIGAGAGQQSRIHCTRLACSKADKWFLRQHPQVLEMKFKKTKQEKNEWLKKLNNVALSSDAFFPFRDNIDRASRSGVKYIVQPGGSIKDVDVIDAANNYGMAMAISEVRLFHH